MAATAFSTLLGFGREIVTAHFYGTNSDMDAFVNASTIPTILFGVFTGALVAALVPTFSEYLSQGREDEVRKLGSTVFNALFIVLSALAMVGWIFAPAFVAVIAHGFPPAEQTTVIRMTRWLMPSIVATGLAGVCAAMLNINNRFLAPALQGVAANVVTIGLVVALNRQLGIFALVLGSSLGLVAQLLVQMPSVLRHRLYRFELDLRHPGLAKTWMFLAPIVMGSAAGQINLAFDRYFASTLSEGSTAGMSYATRLAFLPIQVVAASIATVIFPLIASQFASSNRVGIRRSVSLGLRMVSFIAIPAAAGLSVLAYPIVQTLFERGAFGAAATALCAGLVPFACTQLVAISYNSVLVRACYACQEARWPVVGSVVAVVLNIALSILWLPSLGARGLLLANGVSQLLQTLFLVFLLWRLIQGFELRPLLSSIARISLASLVMVAALYWLNSLGVVPEPTLASRAWYLAGVLVIGSIVFLAVARALGVEELTIVARMIVQKFERGAVSPPETRGGPIA
jgi:putative peptidoglycan lipid II flippase